MKGVVLNHTEGLGPPSGNRVGAVIVGGDFHGLGIIRSLGRRGIPLCVVDDEFSIGRFSKYTTFTVRAPDLRKEKETVDFLNFFSQEKYAKEAAATGGYIPVYKGAESAVKDPLVKHLADDLAVTTYHQNFFDQDLGPSVGRVVNDISVAVAAGQMTPEAAAAAIQEAADQQ